MIDINSLITGIEGGFVGGIGGAISGYFMEKHFIKKLEERLLKLPKA